MAVIQNLKRLQRTLKRLQQQAAKETAKPITVGYSANYALYVHENMEMKLKGQPRRSGSGKGNYWDPQGKAQAKFLEQPAREKQRELAAVVTKAVKNGATIEQALYMAGLHLQRASQQLVPVDTGNLKASAFTRIGE